MTREQELKLIEIGLETLLSGHSKPKKLTGGKKWSDAQREKFRKTMARVWKEKRAKGANT